MDLLKGNNGVDGTVSFEELTEGQRLSLKGDKGEKGDKGDKGDTGAKGADGTMSFGDLTPEQKESLKGDKGDQGIQGIKGDKGEKGDKGDKGDTGEQGIQGIQGPKGDKGDTGIGVPIGGTTGQQLMKKSDTDYDYEWQTPEGGGDMLMSVYDSDGDGIVDNAKKVNGFTVEKNVPAGAQFYDTLTTINGKTGIITKDDIVALGIPAQDTVYTHPEGTNPHGTTKADVGLDNVDNTSDVDKPVSTAQQTALDAKIDADKFQIVAELPTTPTEGVFYFIKE